MRGDRVRYTATSKYDPLHQLTGIVTHLNGDEEDGKHYKGERDDVWVVWDGEKAHPCWVSLDCIKKA